MSESNAAGHGLDENDWRYPGWRVAVASGIGVFVSGFIGKIDQREGRGPLAAIGHVGDYVITEPKP